MVMASFAADSLALGVHWIYDSTRIEKEFGRVETFLKPKEGSYHSARGRGEFTHYGDQAFVLLESIASLKKFDPLDFAKRWMELFDDYDGYYDHATKTTLRNISQGKDPLEAGSSSEDLAGASRLAPLLLCCRDNLDALVDAARTQTKITHNHPMVMDSAEFFARVSWTVLKGQSPINAMEEVTGQHFRNSPLAKWVADGIASKEMESIPTIVRFGQTCHYGDAFPGVVHLIAKYEDNLKEALVQAVMAGGDSAGRGMIVGMVLGAHLGGEGLPEHWMTDLSKSQEIIRHLDAIS